MKEVSISQDDIEDILELSEKIGSHISKLLDGHDKKIAFSSMTNAYVEILANQCDTLDEIIVYRHFFVDVIDNAIRSIFIENPPSL